MISLLKCELLKSKRRYNLLAIVAITALELAWVLYGNYSEDTLAKGWMMFLYQLPLVNAIFTSLLAIVVASALADEEHKGGMFKQLFCLAPRGRLYDAKLIYGLALMFCSLLVQFAGIYIGGRARGFGGSFPLGLYALYWLFTITPTVAIYVFQHSLSLLFKNQTVPFFVGVIGVFIGLFSMFLPQVPFLRKIFLWGWYGSLQFVGNNWDSVTRISEFYLFDIDWMFFVLSLAATALLYGIGKKLFSEREV